MTVLASPPMTTPVAELDMTTGLGPVSRRQQWSGSVLVYSHWEIDAVKAVFRVAGLPVNWDGYGSPRPTNTAVNSAIALLGNIASTGFEDLPVPHVVPVSGGGIQFEWNIGARELEFAASPDGSLEFLKAEGGDPVGEGPLKPVPYSELRLLVGWLMSTAP